MVVDFGKASLIGKAKQQPEKVRMVLEKIKTDGLITTMAAVQSKLGQPIPLGYSNVGIVAETGPDVDHLKPGDRVVSNGRHADIVRVPKNLCARIPDNVDNETAAFTIVASIGLQGIRLANPTLGEYFVIIGAGLIGLLTIQMLRANGCKVLAIDIDEGKLSLAKRFGASTCNLSIGEDPVAAGIDFSQGRGVDGVIICASSKSNDPVTQAARMCRKRGRIVLVGVTGLAINRADFYEKELTFQVSCSYGPGRYDISYEDEGQDYPIGFVRWTERRNFEAVLEMMSEGHLVVEPLISHRFSFDDASSAYESLSSDKNVLGVLLLYDNEFRKRHQKVIPLRKAPILIAQKPTMSFIGAGNYASRVLIPAFKKSGAQLHTIVTSGGTSAAYHGKKYGFLQASTDIDSMLSNDEINVIAIATQHNTHARFVVKALKAGKHVFVEKPLCIKNEELEEIKKIYEHKGTNMSNNEAKPFSPVLMVGFNRRFAPQVQKVKNLLSSIKEPVSFIMTMNAGYIPSNHWTQNTETGGGRIIGEACHYIDLMRFLASSPIVSVQARRMGDSPTLEIAADKAAITLGFANGSFGTIHYLANGHKSFPKERIEVFTAGRVLQIDNFRKLRGFGWPGFRKMNLWRQDKGQSACPAAFINTIEKGGSSPIPLEEIIEVASATLEAAKQLGEQ